MAVYFYKVSRGYSLIVTNYNPRNRKGLTIAGTTYISATLRPEDKFGLFQSKKRCHIYEKYHKSEMYTKIEELEFTSDKVPNTRNIFNVIETETEY